MHVSGSYLSERCEDKSPLVEPRVRQREKFRLKMRIAKEQYVEVNRTWLLDTLVPAAEKILDAEQASHHLCRRYAVDVDLGGHIQEIEIALHTDGFRLVDAGEAVDDETRLDHGADGQKQISGPVAKI